VRRGGRGGGLGRLELYPRICYILSVTLVGHFCVTMPSAPLSRTTAPLSRTQPNNDQEIDIERHKGASSTRVRSAAN